MKKIYILILSAVIFLAFPVLFAQAQDTETLTIATYYPSPFGIYNSLRLFPTTTVPACDSNNEGAMYYDNTVNQLQVCRQTSTMPDRFAWQATGLWTIAGTSPDQHIYPNDLNWRVGIGTSDPEATLEVVADSPFSDITKNDIYLTSYGTATGHSDTATLALRLARGTKAAPQALLADDSVGTYHWAGYNGSNFNQVAYIGAEAEENFTSSPFQMTTRMVFATTNDNTLDKRMTILGNGNVGIGTTSPTTTLEINSGKPAIGSIGFGVSSDGTAWKDMWYDGGNNGEFEIANTSPINTGYTEFLRNVGGTLTHNLLWIGNNGNVGIGTANASAYKLDVAGSIRCTRVTETSPSDISLKKDVVAIPNALARVSALRGVNFYWKDGGDKSLQMGLIAQEVEKVFPEVVSTTEDGKKSIAYTQLIGALVEAIREQQGEVEALKLKVQKLETLIDKTK